MKGDLRFVDCDMHIMEPPDLFIRWLEPRFRDRVITPIQPDGRPARGVWVVDGLATTSDQDTQQYRKPLRRAASNARQPLSGSRSAATGRLDFAIQRDYSPEAQIMGMEMEGVDI